MAKINNIRKYLCHVQQGWYKFTSMYYYYLDFLMFLTDLWEGAEDVCGGGGGLRACGPFHKNSYNFS